MTRNVYETDTFHYFRPAFISPFVIRIFYVNRCNNSLSKLHCIAAILLLLNSTIYAQPETMNDITMSLPRTEMFTFDSVNRPMNGSFSTPNFAAYENAVYKFHFRAKPDEVVWIYWHDFHLEEPHGPNRGCLRNYVEVIIIDYYKEDHVSGRYCGNVAPPNYTTMQHGVDLIFATSGARFYQAFKGTYRFIPEKSVPPPPSIYPGKMNPHAMGCGGIAQGQHGGVIKSPGYPNDYPADVDCNWVIRVRQNMKIFIKVLELELTPSISQCDDAQLVVLDGYAHVPNESLSLTLPIITNHQRIILCGESKYHNDEGLKSVMSVRNRMNIRFKTTKSPPTETRIRRRDFGSPIGFYLVWTEVSTADTCDKFYCRGGDYCIDEGKKVCADRKRYCIDTSLVCDGVPNCAESDDSDEDNCYSKQIVLVGGSIFALLVAVIVVIVCCQRRHARKQLRRAMEQQMARAGSFSSSSDSRSSFAGSRSHSITINRRASSQLASADRGIGNTSNSGEPRDDGLPIEKLMNEIPAKKVDNLTLKRNLLPRNEAGEIAVLPQNRYLARSQGRNASNGEDDDNLEMITFPDIEEEMKTLDRRRPSAINKAAQSKLPSGRFSKVLYKFKTLNEDSGNEDNAETSFSVPFRTSSLKVKAPSYKHPAANRLPKIKILNATEDDGVWTSRRRSSDAKSGGSASIVAQNLTPDSVESDLSPTNTSPLWKEFTTDSKGTCELNIIRRRTAFPNSPPPLSCSIIKDSGNYGDDSIESFSPRPPPTPIEISSWSDYPAQECATSSNPIKYAKAVVRLPPAGILKQSVISKPEISTYRSTVTVDIASNATPIPSTKRTFVTTLTDRSGNVFHPENDDIVRKQLPPSTFKKLPPKPILCSSKSLDISKQPSFSQNPKIMRQKAVEFSDNVQSQIIGGLADTPTSDDPTINFETVANTLHTQSIKSEQCSSDNHPQLNNNSNTGPWRQRIKPTIV